MQKYHWLNLNKTSQRQFESFAHSTLWWDTGLNPASQNSTSFISLPLQNLGPVLASNYTRQDNCMCLVWRIYVCTVWGIYCFVHSEEYHYLCPHFDQSVKVCTVWRNYCYVPTSRNLLLSAHIAESKESITLRNTLLCAQFGESYRVHSLRIWSHKPWF